jgi:hypothetical protein
MADASDLIGIWKLVDAHARDADGNELPPPYGGSGLGVMSFDPSGRMVAAICQGVVEDGEKREYSSYCGHYTFDGKTLVTRVDATAEPARMGSDQVRDVTMDGNRVVLRPPPRPWRGLMQHRQLFWEKVG